MRRKFLQDLLTNLKALLVLTMLMKALQIKGYIQQYTMYHNRLEQRCFLGGQDLRGRVKSHSDAQPSSVQQKMSQESYFIIINYTSYQTKL